MALFGGYDFFVSDQWSLGAGGRVMAAATEHSRFDVSFENSATAFQLLFTALLH
jgi:hypothetical protein